MIGRTILITSALFVAYLGARPALGQRAATYTAFTLTRQLTAYDAAGDTTPVMSLTVYASSGGGWHQVGSYSTGQTFEAVFIPGKGVFLADHVSARLMLMRAVATGHPCIITAEQLRSDPKVVRPQHVLADFAYM